MPMSIEYGWLIERVRQIESSVAYWYGLNGDIDVFTFAVDKAVRFARREDAERVRIMLRSPQDWRAVEHGWADDDEARAEGVLRSLADELSAVSIHAVMLRSLADELRAVSIRLDEHLQATSNGAQTAEDVAGRAISSRGDVSTGRRAGAAPAAASGWRGAAVETWRRWRRGGR